MKNDEIRKRLEEEGIVTINDLFSADLHSIRPFGKKTIDSINDWIAHIKEELREFHSND